MAASGDRLVPLLSRQEIAATVARLAGELDRDYAGRAPLLTGVLRGAFIFLADLVHEMHTPATIEFIRLSSYRTGTETSGRPRVVAGPPVGQWRGATWSSSRTSWIRA
jgi:hypoxanthine phosphoribosyltransferase